MAVLTEYIRRVQLLNEGKPSPLSMSCRMCVCMCVHCLYSCTLGRVNVVRMYWHGCSIIGRKCGRYK